MEPSQSPRYCFGMFWVTSWIQLRVTAIRPSGRSQGVQLWQLNVPIKLGLGYVSISKIADIADESKLPKIHLSMW